MKFDGVSLFNLLTVVFTNGSKNDAEKKEKNAKLLKDYSALYLLSVPKDMLTEQKKKVMAIFIRLGFSKEELTSVKNFLSDEFKLSDAKKLNFDGQLEVYRNIFGNNCGEYIKSLRDEKLVESLAKMIINPSPYGGFEIINKEGEKGNDAKYAFRRLGEFLCSDECSEYSSTALGVALEKIFANYPDDLKGYDEVRGEFKSVTFAFGSMLKDGISGVNGLNNLARMFDRANLDFLKENIYCEANMTYLFCHSEIRNKIGYVTSKISEEKQKSILDFIKNNQGRFGSSVIKECNRFKKMSDEEIKETFGDGIQSNYNNKSNKDKNKDKNKNCLIF